MNVTGSDSLILAGAALYLVGELLFGDLLGGGSSSSLFLGNGLTLAGVLAGLVLFFLYFVGPRGGRQGLISAKTLQVIVAALVVGITLYALSDFLATLRNLGSIPDLGIFGILQQLCRWAGAVLMALGVSAAWAPITTPTPTTPTPPAAKT